MPIRQQILNISKRLYSDIKATNLQIEKSVTCSLNSHSSPYGFGKCFTDHMLEVHWDNETGWGTPKISPFHNLNVHPAAKGIQYSFEAFEGLKSMKGTDGKIRLFRPQMHMERFLTSCRKMSLPGFNTDELLKCIIKLVQADISWQLAPESNTFVYLRPTILSTDPYLGFNIPNKAMIYVVMAISESYLAPGSDSMSLYIDENNKLRPNGRFKLGTNYGPIADSLLLAQKNNCHQCLWVFGEDHFITEAGTVNFFAVITNKNGIRELVTPSLDCGYLLPGVTRNSILKICGNMEEYTVTERNISVLELQQAQSEGRLVEMFCSGTAMAVKNVDKIIFQGNTISAPGSHSLLNDLSKKLDNIMRGREDPFSWNLII